MIVLGIESSCDDTGAAVLRDGHELSNVVASQEAVHGPYVLRLCHQLFDIIA